MIQPHVFTERDFIDRALLANAALQTEHKPNKNFLSNQESKLCATKEKQNAVFAEKVTLTMCTRETERTDTSY